jgi:glyoxylase-like metal-dependent hydrolase (beta-lactamase superfamily II)
LRKKVIGKWLFVFGESITKAHYIAKCKCTTKKNSHRPMRISFIDTGFFKLDGGAMFGVVPKTLWSKQNPADDKNRCTWAMRCLLVEDGPRLILIDTGLGNKQDDRFFGFYDLHGEASLTDSIRSAGYELSDITDVILTHLHFDHVGGAVIYDAQRHLVPAFPNAIYWTHHDHWNWAINPNPRERASFLADNIRPLETAGQLRFLDPQHSPFDNVELIRVDGHTEAMLLPLISYKDRKILFAADLIPSSYHIPQAWIMSYDVRPLISMTEKENFLQQAVDASWILFFEHDPIYQAAVVERGEKGFRIRERGDLHLFL